MQSFWHLLLIALMGSIGTLCRWGLGGVVQHLAGSDFPWGTFVVNAVGSFLFGLVFPLAEERFLITGETRQVILTGFMGAFTTFSTFMFETTALVESQAWFMAAGNLFGQIIVGLIFMMLGLALGRML